MSFIRLPEEEDLKGDALQLTKEASERWGYAPNIVRAYSLAPKVMVAEDVWSRGVMHDGHLPRAIKEAIATVVSSVNQTDYCSASHAHAYTLAGGSVEDALSCKMLEFNHFNPRDRAALEFAKKATTDPKSITPEDHKKLSVHYNPGEVVEICTVIQQFMGYNWFVTMLGLKLEEENPLNR